MSDMATQSARGTKRTCQNEACGARFYDLTHHPITCPICQTVFVPPPDTKGKPTWKAARNVPRHTIVAPEAVENVAEGETAELELAETAADDDTDVASETPDQLLELDEDGDASDSGVVIPETKD